MFDGEIVKKKFPLKKFCLGFQVLFSYLSRTFRCLSSLSCLCRQQQVKNDGQKNEKRWR